VNLVTLLAVFLSLVYMSLHAAPQASAPPRTLAERLGYKATDKLLIIHADDVGMCHSVNAATIQAMEKGVVTCASIMVPCPWMPEIAAYCRDHPDADFGLHLTLNSEWKYYRWRPVAPGTEVASLLDAEGFLPRTVLEVAAHARPAEVEKEVRAQIARARAFGIRPTHVDSHMGTLFFRAFFPIYTRAARESGLVPMLPGPTPERIQQAKLLGLDMPAIYAALTREGFVFLDALYENAQGDTLEARRQHYYDLFRRLKPGVTEIIVHLSLNDDEIRHITSSWEARWNEYQIFTDPRTKELLDSLGIKLIGYRQLRALAFQPPASSPAP